MRVNVYVPDELVERAKQRHPSFNASHVFQDALRSLASCGHDVLECRSCGAELLTDVVARSGQEALFSSTLEALEALMIRGGTVEGAIKVVVDVSRRMNVRAAFSSPLPRLSRAERAAQSETHELEEAV